MKAAVAGQNALEIRDVKQPQPKPAEVLVRVCAIGMNRPSCRFLTVQDTPASPAKPAKSNGAES